MRTTIFLLFLALTAPHAFSQNSEDDNIKKAIKLETDAFYNNDNEAWQNMWVHSSKTSAMFIGNGYYNPSSGWDSLGARAKRYFDNTAKNGKVQVDVTTDGFNISNNGNMAWVEYDQTTITHGKDSNSTNNSHEYRVLVKENNEWKILSAIANNVSSFNSVSADAIENNLNAAGYNLMTAGRLNDAIEVFRTNVKINPKSWNPYDSLGEGLAAAGKKKEAIENYEMSVKLNPKNDNGIQMLKKLKAK
jgi:tetratricopeptide (TPR) repeat protein